MRRRGRESGFSLIETIAAMVILAAAVPPTLLAIQDALVARVAPTQLTRARWLVTERLESAIADRHSTTRGYVYLTGANYPAEASITGFPGFSRATSIVETAADLVTAGTGYKRITVTVSWTDTRGDPRSLAISAVVTEYAA